MTDQPESAREGGDEILSRIFASDLPEEEKRRLLLILLAKRKSAEQGILAEADQLIAEAEALLKGQQMAWRLQGVLLQYDRQVGLAAITAPQKDGATQAWMADTDDVRKVIERLDTVIGDMREQGDPDQTANTGVVITEVLEPPGSSSPAQGGSVQLVGGDTQPQVVAVTHSLHQLARDQVDPVMPSPLLRWPAEAGGLIQQVRSAVRGAPQVPSDAIHSVNGTD